MMEDPSEDIRKCEENRDRQTERGLIDKMTINCERQTDRGY